MRAFKFGLMSLLILQLFGCMGLFSSHQEPVLIPPTVFDAPPPVSADALWQQAEIEEKAGDLEAAAGTLEKIKRTYPTNAVSARALYRLGNLSLDQGKADRALKYFDELVANYPRWEGMPMVWVDRLRALRAKGEKTEVLKQGLALWQVSSDYPQMQVPLSLLLANTYKDTNNLPGAFEWLSVAFEKVQTPAQKESLARDTLSILKHVDEPAVQKLLAGNPSETTRVFLEFRLAQIEEQKGKVELARQRLTRLAAHDEGHPLAMEIRAALAEIPSNSGAPPQSHPRPGTAAGAVLAAGTSTTGKNSSEASRSTTGTVDQRPFPPSLPVEAQHPLPPEAGFKGPDEVPPEIRIIHPTSLEPGREAVVSQSSNRVTIKGTATDNAGVAAVLVNNKQAQLDENGSFSADVLLKVGRNAVQVRAMDIHENAAVEELTIVREGVALADAAGPKSAAAPSTRFAVIIGLSAYQDSRIPSLRYAAEDARSFYEWIVSPGGGGYAPSRVKLLLNGEATGKNIKDALFVWLKQALEEDMVTIYFAGHGSPESPSSPGNLFLLPFDTQYDSIATTGFPMWDIETALRRFIKAKKVVVIADACHAGGVGQAYDSSQVGRRGLEEVNPISTGFQNLSKVGDGICVISASDDKQFSQESETWGGGHGVFTFYLLEGLKGAADYNQDTRVTLGELIPYLSEQVRRETKNTQSPTVAGKFDPALSIGNRN